MNNVLINGNFLCRNLTGVERFTLEVCSRLDSLITEKDSVSILVPANARTVPNYKNIKIIRSKKDIRHFPLWDMGIFAYKCKNENFLALNFGNTAPLGKTCGIAFIHDIYAHDCSKDFTSFRDKIVKIYCCFQYRNICSNALKIITVSQFSKDRIKKVYNVPENKITVIGNGWEHLKDIECDESIFAEFPNLVKKNYYFTLGSLSKRKNLEWITEYAKKHQNDIFAISGKAIRGLVPKRLKELQDLSNIILLGYTTDSQVKALMKNCKAFIFPSYYEGFGIPPLEALSVGAQIIISQSASLPEIYGNSAHYIDIKNTDINLNELLNQTSEQPDKILKRYTYDRAAEQLLAVLKDINNTEAL
ncbi:MAG: glycosyltransferase family 4 protein [Treponema sp.]|nr:glycosyltransferase family 4 protein [Treponema sp.]